MTRPVWETEVEHKLLERAAHVGLGRAMHLIAQQWARQDPVGALTVGPARSERGRDPRLSEIVERYGAAECVICDCGRQAGPIWSGVEAVRCACGALWTLSHSMGWVQTQESPGAVVEQPVDLVRQPRASDEHHRNGAVGSSEAAGVSQPRQPSAVESKGPDHG
jgi:hypothetical protein